MVGLLVDTAEEIRSGEAVGQVTEHYRPTETTDGQIGEYVETLCQECVLEIAQSFQQTAHVPRNGVFCVFIFCTRTLYRLQ